MPNNILFTHHKELEATENLLGFIDMCRNQLTIFGQELAFDDLVWDITAFMGKKKKISLSFCTWRSSGTKHQVPMAQPFILFAKAYIRYQHGMRPNKDIRTRLFALRMLEAALTENSADASPAWVDTRILNRAVQLCQENYSSDTAYIIAQELQGVGRFLSENRLMHTPVGWSHSLKRKRPTTKIGKEFDERRAEKLPSQRALDGLAHIFQIADSPGDVLISALTAILCSAPDRISEVLALPLDCEVRQADPKTGDTAYGLRWWPVKGAAPMVKWIIPSMVSIVEEAVRRIRNLTEDGRHLAKWYEENPHQIYLQAQLEYLRNQEMLSMAELGSVLFVGDFDPTSPPAWVRANKIKTVRDMRAHGRPTYVRFADVEKTVLNMLPYGFPVFDEETGLKYSDALCVVRRNTLTEWRATLQCVVEPIKYGHVQHRLSNGTVSKTLFDTFGFTEEDGSRIRIRTHQFRHYLNTLAQRGGLSQLDIAKWSGRRDVGQNSAYDHVSGQELVAQLRDAVGNPNRMIGPATTVAKAMLIPRDEFARLKIPTAHTTELGFCIHDFTMSPCQIHRDCMSCDELVCVKGDAVKAKRIRQLHTETTTLLAAATEAAAAENAGADRWVEHQRAVLERLDQLCTIFDDPAVPDGAFIQQSYLQQTSRMQIAAQARPYLLAEGKVLGASSLPSMDATLNAKKERK